MGEQLELAYVLIIVIGAAFILLAIIASESNHPR
jgi:hypothetical protein